MRSVLYSHTILQYIFFYFNLSALRWISSTESYWKVCTLCLFKRVRWINLFTKYLLIASIQAHPLEVAILSYPMEVSRGCLSFPSQHWIHSSLRSQSPEHRHYPALSSIQGWGGLLSFSRHGEYTRRRLLLEALKDLLLDLAYFWPDLQRTNWSRSPMLHYSWWVVLGPRMEVMGKAAAQLCHRALQSPSIPWARKAMGEFWFWFCCILLPSCMVSLCWAWVTRKG